jgi:cyclohexanone monooxygenase
MAGPVYNFDPVKLRQKYMEERDKRLRRDGLDQYREASGELSGLVDDPYASADYTRPPVIDDVDVVVLGGGFAGLLTAAKLRDQGIASLRVIEQASDFGGVWYWNRYPGIRCDVESYVYMPLLEEVGTIPTEKYATGREIFEHCRAIARHYRLYDDALLQTKVERIAWDADEARWIITTDRNDRIRARNVCVGNGPLHKVKLPGVPGIADFKGRIFHSARWDYSYTGGDADGKLDKLKDKRVAIVGTGGTAVQIVPKVAASAQHLYLFQRTPSVIDERNNRPTDIEWFKSQPKGWTRARRDNFLSILLGVPQKENLVDDRWTEVWSRFAIFGGDQVPVEDGAGSQAERLQMLDYDKMEEIRARVSEFVKNKETAEALKPWYNVFCKRPLYADDFLPVFNQGNVTLVDTQGRGIDRITESGVVFDGVEYPVDLLIFATGFDVGAPAYRAGAYELVGRDGISLAQSWADGVHSLHGTQVHGFPNFHIVGGVAQGTAASNFTHTLEMQADHAAEIIGKVLQTGVRTWEITESAEKRWAKVLEKKQIDRTQFYEDCTPGYFNNEGDFEKRQTFVGGTYGGGPFEYNEVIKAWRADPVSHDLEITYGRDQHMAQAEHLG